MKEELIIKILNKSMAFLSVDQIKNLRVILDEELYNYDLSPAVTALVPINDTPQKIMIYLASKKLDGLSDNTLNNYKRYLMKFAQIIQKDLENITSMDIRIYLAAYAKSGAKNSSVATVISIFKSFFNWLSNNDYILKSPMNTIKTTKTEKYLRKALTQEELEMLRVSCKTTREHALVEFFYSTGCRLDEVQKLNKSDIDWSNKSVLVFGKGKKERQVYLNAKAKIHLWEYFNSRRDQHEALFVTERQPYNRLSHRMMQQVFNVLGKRAGLQKRVYPHLLRHTTATSMLNNGASLAEVQKYLGHSSPSTTQVYAQLDTEALQQSHKRHLS